jgi:hypothetical protein
MAGIISPPGIARYLERLKWPALRILTPAAALQGSRSCSKGPVTECGRLYPQFSGNGALS